MNKRQAQVVQTLEIFYQNPIAKISLELFLTIGLVLFLAVFAIRPTLLTMSELLKEIEDKSALNVKLAQKVAALATAQSEFLTYQDELSVLDEAIPSTPQTVQALKIMEKLAGENSVVITSISVAVVPEEVESSTVVKKLTLNSVSLTIAGDYVSIRSFVEALKQNRRLFVIDTVNFGVNENQKNTKLIANISVNFPYFSNEVSDSKKTKGNTSK